VLEKYPREDTAATDYGTKLHEQCELFIRDGRPLDADFKFMQPMLDRLNAMPGRKFPEYEMALTKDLRVCEFKDPNRWVRGIADLVIVNDDNFTAYVVDYKTGNNKYPDRDQLILMSLMVFKHFPHIKYVKSALLFVVKNSMVKHEMGLEDVEPAWWDYRERVAKLTASHTNDVWNPKSTPLCGWCQVTGCEFHPRH